MLTPVTRFDGFVLLFFLGSTIFSWFRWIGAAGHSFGGTLEQECSESSEKL